MSNNPTPDQTESSADAEGEQPPEDLLDESLDDQVDLDDSGDGNDLLSFVTGGGISQMLLQEQYEDPETGHTYSQADLIADVVNVMRMDAKQIAALHGIEVEVSKMTPEHAAKLMEKVTQEGGVDIISVFQDIEDKHDKTLQDLFDEEDHAEYMRFKQQMLYSVADDAEAE
jgi:hypothetical protein